MKKRHLVVCVTVLFLCWWSAELCKKREGGKEKIIKREKKGGKRGEKEREKKEDLNLMTMVLIIFLWHWALTAG